MVTDPETRTAARRDFLFLLCLMLMAPLGEARAQGWPPWADDAFQGRHSWSREPQYREETPGRTDIQRPPSAGAVQNGGARPDIVPRTPQVVPFAASYPVNSIVIDTSTRKLYFVLEGNRAYGYSISVGREGFNWVGTESVSRKQAWPDWHPPAEMRERDPKLPEKMTGGLKNPLGAIAIYLGNTLYRIHGTNDPKSIGRAASSGCFRMLNEDVLHLASIVEIGMPVAVVNSLSAAPEVSQKTGPLRPAPEQSAQEPVIAQQMEMITPNHRARDYQTLRREMLHRP
jgi:lipoprotein-anchoring transpeptidase ErfK/SrfK